jgi:hypothetical protein
MPQIGSFQDNPQKSIIYAKMFVSLRIFRKKVEKVYFTWKFPSFDSSRDAITSVKNQNIKKIA